MKCILSIILVFILSLSVKANFDFNNRCKLAYEKVMVFDFGSAERVLMAEKAMNPRNKVPVYIETYIAFFRAALSEKPNRQEEFESLSSKSIDLIKEDNQESPFKNYFLSDIYIQSSYLRAVTNSYMSAAYRFNKAYDLAIDNQKEYPSFIPNNKLLGLMNIGIGSVPENYNWLLKLFNFEGDINKGMQQMKVLLKQTVQNDEYSYLLSESLFLYSFTLVNFDLDQESEKELKNIYLWGQVQKEIESNQFMSFSKASFLSHIKENDQAIDCLKKCIPSKDAQRFYYLDYMLGECLLYKQDSGSEIYLKRYINQYQGNSYRRSAYQKWAWIALLDGDKLEYQERMKQSLQVGNDLRDSDGRATKAAENGESPNPILLKARLLFDGGYYQRAYDLLKDLNKNDLKEDRDKAELVYRLGRIFDEWGKGQKARVYYENCIEDYRSFNFYFAANSALHLGYLYESSGEIEKARESFQSCLEMDFDEYHNSITQKAKAALNRLDHL